MTFEVAVHREFRPDLERVWRTLEAASESTPFQNYDWVARWQATIGAASPPVQPCVAVASAGGRPVALFPFGLRRSRGVRELMFLGGDQADYNAPLLSRDLPMEAFPALWQAVLAALPRHDLRLFPRLLETLGHIPNPLPLRLPVLGRRHAYAATLPRTWDAFRSRLSAQFRSNSGRKWRRLAGRGHLRLVEAGQGVPADRILAAMREQKARRLLETGARNVMALPEIQAFYGGPGGLGDRGRIHLTALMLDDEPLATHWGMVYGGCYYWILPSFAAGEWEWFSPGRLLLEQLIQWAIGQGLEVFDFTVGGEEYKKTWCDRELGLADCGEAVSLRGAVALGAARLSQGLKTHPGSRRFLMGALGMARRIGGWRQRRDG